MNMQIGMGYGELTDNELAHLADWADYKKNTTSNPEWKKAFALIREGADLLLRRKAACREEETQSASPEVIKPTKR